MRIFISSPLFYKGGKLMKASDLNLIGSWNVSDILIKTKDENNYKKFWIKIKDTINVSWEAFWLNNYFIYDNFRYLLF